MTIELIFRHHFTFSPSLNPCSNGMTIESSYIKELSKMIVLPSVSYMPYSQQFMQSNLVFSQMPLFFEGKCWILLGFKIASG